MISDLPTEELMGEKDNKAAPEKAFRVEIRLQVERQDCDKTLLNQRLTYENMTRGDIVAVQDVLAQACVTLVDLGYASVELRGGAEEAAAAQASRAVIRREAAK
jgi:hypothetical protein